MRKSRLAAGRHLTHSAKRKSVPIAPLGLKGIITGLIVVCFNAVICDPCNTLDKAWITKSLSHRRFLYFVAKSKPFFLYKLQWSPIWEICFSNTICFYQANPSLTTVPRILGNKLMDLLKGSKCVCFCDSLSETKHVLWFFSNLHCWFCILSLSHQFPCWPLHDMAP